MLEFTIIVSFFLHKYVDMYLIGCLMLFNAIIGFVQERKAAKTVKALKSSLQVMVRVLRGGKWGTSKIAKTLFTVVFVCLSFLITGQFVVGAFDMILLLFLVDFVALTLSTDTVTGSQKPGSWKIKSLVRLGFVLGLLNCTEAFAWFFIGQRYLSITSTAEMHSFGFAILFFTGVINILVVRTPRRFYQQPIGKVLLFAVIADTLFAIIILTLGIPGFTALPPIITAGTLLYFLVCGFLVNDRIKIKVQEKSGVSE